MALLGGDERGGKIKVCVFFVCACHKCGRYSSKWLTSGQLPFLHRLALQQQPGASLACRSSLCLLFVLQHSLAHWLSDRFAQEVLCDVTCDKKQHVDDGSIIYIQNILHSTVVTNILVSDLFLLPWIVFLPNDCHSWGVLCNMTVQTIHCKQNENEQFT